MPIFPTSENYNGLGSLYQNAGDWVDAELTFTNRFSRGSGTSNTVTYNVLGNNYWLEFQTGDWGDYGFLAGDPIVLTGTIAGVPFSIAATVAYVSGNQLYLTTPIAGLTAGAVFPTSGSTSGMLIVADKLPDSLEFYFNLTQQNANNLLSLIDGEVQRFEAQGVAALSPGGTLPMVQLGNKSGGYVTDVELTYINSTADGTRDFRITYKFWDWGVIQNGIEPPAYYPGPDHLAPICGLKAFSQYGNPNGVNEANTTNLQANTGFFDENYNQGNNPNTFVSINWFDALGNPISALDYSGNCTFQAVVTAPNQNNPLSTYRLGLVWRPVDGTQYQNLPDSIANNLMLLAPETNFIADGVQVAGPFPGFTHPSGAQWDLANVTFTLSGSTLTIDGEIQPNAAATNLFAGIPDGGRKSTLWVSIGDHTKDGTINSDRVNLRLFDEDNIDAPTLGVQIPDVISETLEDHGNNDILTPEPQTTTEDDVLYKSEFLLVDNVQYEAVYTTITAYNTVTGDEFELERHFFSFANVVNINGQFQPNFTNPRGFNLPPTTDRNHVSLKRKPSLDIAGKYGIELEYGFLNDWRYWMAQNNVDNFFFNINEPLNGKNKNWQKFYDTPNNWKLRINYFTRVAGVDDFNHYELGDRPYEDEPTVSTAVNFTVLSTGATPTQLVANELIEVECIFTLSSGVWNNEWVEHTVEDYEAGNRWVISSYLPQGNVAANPLKPIAGQTLIDVTGSGTAVLTTKSVIDTNLVSANKVSMSFRVYSEGLEYMIEQEAKLPRLAYSLRKVTAPTFYNGPCIRVRRQSDDAEQDIGFNGLDLDVASLESFCAGTNGYVTTWYDQSGNSKNAVRSVLSQQPQIVSSGTVLTDPDNGNPAILFDGVDDFLGLTGETTTQLFMQLHVFNRASSTFSIGLADPAASPFVMLWTSANIIYSNMGASTLHDSGQTQTGDFLHLTYRDNANLLSMRQNGVAKTAITVAPTVQTLTYLGNRNGQRHNGYMQELLYWNTDQQINIAAYEASTNNYWGIY